jgi:hypothetical protein
MGWKRRALILIILFGGVVVLLNWLGLEPDSVRTLPPVVNDLTPLPELGGLVLTSHVAGAEEDQL